MVKKLVYGVGLNDADYKVSPRVCGKPLICPFYSKWCSLLSRCYSEKRRIEIPSYGGCYVADEWHSFMDFRVWMSAQDWQGNELDKDLLVEGNKVYGPDTCIFITHEVNTFLVRNDSLRGDYPIGVSFYKNYNKYQASVSLNNKSKNLGYFDTPEDAHKAWRVAKYKLAIELALKQTDQRVSKALIKRYYVKEV